MKKEITKQLNELKRLEKRASKVLTREIEKRLKNAASVEVIVVVDAEEVAINEAEFLAPLRRAVEEAEALVLALYESRKSRASHPEGRFDRAGRWYAASVDAEVIADVRSPSRAFPYS